MEKIYMALIVIGVASITAFVVALLIYVGYRSILWALSPEVGSNAHLREWLNAGGTWEDFNTRFGS